MDIETLNNEYDKATTTTSFSRHQKFIKSLLSSSDTEIVSYHFNLLKKRENWNLYTRIRAAFKKRGPATEEFLIERARKETDTDLQADALHLLGQLNSKAAIPLSIDFISHQDPTHRETACCVLGWLGSESELSFLADRLLSDPDDKVRATAATSLEQMRLRLPETRSRLLTLLERALNQETNKEVVAWIIITLQYIMEKELGLKEDIEEAGWSGDIEKARERAERALALM